MPSETTYTSLRENLATVLDQVVDQQETVIVRRRGARDVALIPASELAGLVASIVNVQGTPGGTTTLELRVTNGDGSLVASLAGYTIAFTTSGPTTDFGGTTPPFVRATILGGGATGTLTGPNGSGNFDYTSTATLPAAASGLYRDAGMESLARIQQKWQRYRAQVPQVADFVDASLAELERQVGQFTGAGLVASHNDICNANWLVTPEGRLYLIDLESVSLGDPALDIGATLWWYYPPELRQRFLAVLGYAGDEPFQARMRVRMAMHCLDIALPREGSFDEVTPESFAGWLTDFRAAFAGQENPQGYDNLSFTQKV